MYGTSLPRDSRFPWTGTIPNRHIVRNVTTTAQHAAHNTARCNTTRTITIMHHTAYNTNIDCISLSHIYVSIKSSNPTVQHQYVNPYLSVYLYRSHLTCIHTLIYHMPQKPETKNKTKVYQLCQTRISWKNCLSMGSTSTKRLYVSKLLLYSAHPTWRLISSIDILKRWSILTVPRLIPWVWYYGGTWFYKLHSCLNAYWHTSLGFTLPTLLNNIYVLVFST